MVGLEGDACGFTRIYPAALASGPAIAALACRELRDRHLRRLDASRRVIPDRYGGFGDPDPRVESPVVPIAMLAAGFAVTFGSAAMGVAVMQLRNGSGP